MTAQQIGTCNQNRMVFVMEDIQQGSCNIYGLDSKDKKSVQEKLRKILPDEWYHLQSVKLPVKCLYVHDRASTITPVLESLNYEFYQVSDTFSEDKGFTVTWRFVKKI